MLHAQRAITVQGEVACTVAVRGGRIAAVGDFGTDLAADRVVRLAGDEVLLPGLVDTHGHVNDPGLMIVHAEDGYALEHAPSAEGRGYGGFLASRPRGAENLAIAEVIEAARSTGGRLHILHLSSADALPMIRSARRDRLRLAAEVCPHT